MSVAAAIGDLLERRKTLTDWFPFYRPPLTKAPGQKGFAPPATGLKRPDRSGRPDRPDRPDVRLGNLRFTYGQRTRNGRLRECARTPRTRTRTDPYKRTP
ncbi:hypothetical protein SSP35_12_01300 [Streptomyces sp. NBRC 110611]|nr:hypothetical protein SSP35_12_01300 [Streptomyces sp. NBRC 110611]